MFIAVIGPVGLGKSTLSEALASRFDVPLLPEPWEKNEYIPHLPLHVFSCQYKMLKIMREHSSQAAKTAKKGPVICDRIYNETFDIFCRQYRHALTPEEWEALENYATNGPAVPLPDIIFALQGSPEVAYQRIRERGRSFEIEKLTPSYCREQDVLYRGLVSKLSERTTVHVLDASATPEKVLTQALRSSKLGAKINA